MYIRKIQCRNHSSLH